MLEQIKAERERQIREIVEQAAKRIAALSRKAGHGKQLFNHKDRRHRFARKIKQEAQFRLLMEAYTTSSHIWQLMAQPIPRYQEGSPHPGGVAIVGEEVFGNMMDAYPEFDLNAPTHIFASTSPEMQKRIFPKFERPLTAPSRAIISKGVAEIIIGQSPNR